MDQLKTIYEVRLKKETRYFIKAESEEEAIEKAQDLFDEMYPEIETERVITEIKNFDPEIMYPKNIKWRLVYCLDLLYALTEKGGTKKEIQDVLKYEKILLCNEDADQAFKNIHNLYLKYVSQELVGE